MVLHFKHHDFRDSKPFFSSKKMAVQNLKPKGKRRKLGKIVLLQRICCLAWQAQFLVTLYCFFFVFRRSVWLTYRSIFHGGHNVWWSPSSMFSGRHREFVAPQVAEFSSWSYCTYWLTAHCSLGNRKNLQYGSWNLFWSCPQLLIDDQLGWQLLGSLILEADKLGQQTYKDIRKRSKDVELQ